MPIHLAQASLATLLPQGQLQSQPVAASGTDQAGEGDCSLSGGALKLPGLLVALSHSLVFDSLCGCQIKPGKLPIFYRITGRHCADHTDRCGLSYVMPIL